MITWAVVHVKKVRKDATEMAYPMQRNQELWMYCATTSLVTLGLEFSRMSTCLTHLRAAALRTMMFCALVVPVFCVQSTAVGADRSPDTLVGTWHLVRYVDTPNGGVPVQAYGAEPIGLFIFAPDGHVSFSIMRNPPDINAATTDPDPEACIPDWYCAYFGTYTVNYERGTWVTHVLVGNIPAYLGTDQTRNFKIKGDTLTISETYLAGSQQVHAERVLRRNTPSH